MSARNIEACLCFFTLSPSSDSFMLKSTAWSNKSDSEQLPEHFVRVWLSRKKKKKLFAVYVSCMFPSFLSSFTPSARKMDHFVNSVVFVLKCMKCKATARGCKMKHILPLLYDFSSTVKSHFFKEILGLHAVGLSAMKSVLNRRTDRH